MLFGKKSYNKDDSENFKILEKQPVNRSVRTRDVYTDQQLERSDIEKPLKMTSRLIVAIICTVLVFIALWAVVALGEMFLTPRPKERSPHPNSTYIPVEEHYEIYRSSQVSDAFRSKLTVEDFNVLKNAYDPSAVVPELPIDPSTVYQRGVLDGYDYKGDDPAYGKAHGEHITKEEFEALIKEYDADMAAYNEAVQKSTQVMVLDKTITDQKGWQDNLSEDIIYYRLIPFHYRSRDDFSVAITAEQYDKLVADYEAKVQKGKISEDLLDVPTLYIAKENRYIIDPSKIYEPLEYGDKIVGSTESTTPAPTTAVAGVDDTKGGTEGETQETELTEATPTPAPRTERGPITYVNRLDGSVISYQEYDRLVEVYTKDMTDDGSEDGDYYDLWLAHRKQYHPDDIWGTKMVYSMAPTKWKCLISFCGAAILFSVLYILLKRNLDAANLMRTTSDINQYHYDQHIMLPEEIQRKFDWFPDVGAHSAVQVSSMISHMALQNKGVKKFTVYKRAKKDIKDKNGNIEYYKGDVLYDEKGEPISESLPVFDTDFMQDLFTASGVAKGKEGADIRKFFDPTKIPYNPDGSNRDKLGKYNTLADLINADWEFPEYEPQRPGGAYVVDTAPVNTMVLAITRAGKGQTIIEPTIDMWTREKRLNNMVINDPKGELLVKNYAPGTIRGMQVVQFNLINPMKTDIYNPLALAADAAREGDIVKCSMYVQNIADVFFPVDGADDPVWPNAANNAFKRAAYGLIDYYLEEEKAMRRLAERVKIDPKVLDQRIDEMWGRVTLYNCYQLFVQLTAKKMKNPATEFNNEVKAGKYNDVSDEAYQELVEQVKIKSQLWEDKPDADCLSLFFTATEWLPKNEMRTLVGNANNALKSMGGAEKMMASVYGIAITAMSFFTDPTISTLTSGTLNQNVDLGGLSFPRRFGVRFNIDYMQMEHFVGLQAIFDAYTDDTFTTQLGKEFHHEDTITREGWARYYFDGKFEGEIGYFRLEVRNPDSNMLVRTFYFKFTKGYQTSFDGRVYIKDPLLGVKVVKNGIIVELRKFKKKDGTIVFRPAKTTFLVDKITDIKEGSIEKVKSNAIQFYSCRYVEKPKMVFLVTPPHLMSYAKIVLILLKQLVDLNFDKSYMTKANQKPLYKTRFMLDELGNLQSEGHGISNFETMLSIGLGQEQQFTLILQTLAQLEAVYNDSGKGGVDRIVRGNTSNIVFLKSTDIDMIENLEKTSGVTHRVYKSSKTITTDVKAVVKAFSNEGKQSIQMSAVEEKVIKANDMLFIPERNSIVFRAGDSPIWNRNETILPMSWRLFDNKIIQPGKKYTLQTIPTLSTAMDFDVRKNQPNFRKMLDKRMEQAYKSKAAQDRYKEVHGYTDDDVARLDPDNYADEIMDIICTDLNPEIIKQSMTATANEDKEKMGDEEELTEVFDYLYGNDTKKDKVFDDASEVSELFKDLATESSSNEVSEFASEEQRAYSDHMKKRYGNGLVSRADLVSYVCLKTKAKDPDVRGMAVHGLDGILISAYNRLKNSLESDDKYFTVVNNSLCSVDGRKVYIRNNTGNDNRRMLNEAIKSSDKRTFADAQLTKEDMDNIGSYEVTDEFLHFLCSFNTTWPFANGEFDRAVGRLIKEESLDGIDDSPAKDRRR